MPNTSSTVLNKVRWIRCAWNLACAFLVALTLTVTWKTSAAENSSADTSVHVIVIEGMKFSPSVIHIKPGERVIFKNSDLVPHTATSTEKKVFDSGAIKPGESWTINPTPAQTIHYACTFHPMMKGEIVVDKP